MHPEPARSTRFGNLLETHEEHRRGRALEWAHAVKRELVTRAAPSRPSIAGSDGQE